MITETLWAGFCKGFSWDRKGKERRQNFQIGSRSLEKKIQAQLESPVRGVGLNLEPALWDWQGPFHFLSVPELPVGRSHPGIQSRGSYVAQRWPEPTP